MRLGIGICVFFGGVLMLVPAMGAAAELDWRGEVRVRAEMRTNPDFDDRTDDDVGWIGTRTRLGVLAGVHPQIDIGVQGQYTNLAGGSAISVGDPAFTQAFNGGNNFDTGVFEMDQAFLRLQRLGDRPLTLTVGRQHINLGDQRLVGSFNYSMVARRYDAVRLQWTPEEMPFDLDLFAARVDDGAVTTVTQSFFKGTDLLGVYGRTRALPNLLTEAYTLLKRDGRRLPGELAGTADRSVIVTIGSRMELVDVPQWSVVAEGAGQFGEQHGDNHRAWAAALNAYGELDRALAPGVGLRLRGASGDGSADGDSRAFDNLFPTNHAKYGAMDLFGWTDLYAIALRAGVRTETSFSFYVDTWRFWREASLPGVDRDAGWELDLTLEGQWLDHVFVLAHYGVFWADDRMSAVPAEDPIGQLATASLEGRF